MPGHHHAAAQGATRVSVRVAVRWIAAALFVMTLVGLVALWPSDAPEVLEGGPFDVEQANATVTAMAVAPCFGTTPADGIDCRDLSIRVTSGRTDGDDASIQQAIVAGGIDLVEGDRIVVSRTAGAPEGLEYTFVDFQRQRPLMVLALLFAFAVILLGRLQGVRALIGAAVAMLVLIAFMLPALLEGASPMLIALVGASAIAFVALYVTHGISDGTTVALLGTLASLAVVAVLGANFVAATNVTGLVSEESGILQITAGQIDFRGLLLAGVVIGALGVLDDVTVTQVSAVTQLQAADPSLPPRELYRTALTIGRDHIASTVNTLVLAYAGASLPLLLLFTQSAQPLSRALTGEVVAVEIVRTLVGSIGLVAAVPITTGLAVALVRRPMGPPTEDPSVDSVDSVDATVSPVPTRAPTVEEGDGWEGFVPEETEF